MQHYQPEPQWQKADRIYATTIDGLLYIDAPLHEDERGFYRETALLPDLNQVLPQEFAVRQVNHARSLAHVVRGIHMENWNKLVTVTGGVALCVLVDLRPTSSTYLQKEYIRLGVDPNDNKVLSGSLYVPAGVGNSVGVVTAPVDYIYVVDQLYRERDTSFDQAVSIFDPELAIEWPWPRTEIIQSERDKRAVSARAAAAVASH